MSHQHSSVSYTLMAFSFEPLTLKPLTSTQVEHWKCLWGDNAPGISLKQWWQELVNKYPSSSHLNWGHLRRFCGHPVATLVNCSLSQPLTFLFSLFHFPIDLPVMHLIWPQINRIQLKTNSYPLKLIWP